MKAYITNLLLWGSLLAIFAQSNTAISNESSAKLPAEAFYHLPAIQNPQLSPDGTHVLAIKNDGSFSSVMVLNLATGERFYPTKTDNVEFTFNWVRWAGNDRILLSLAFAQTSRGTEQARQNTRLLSMDAKRESKMVAMVKPKDGDKYLGASQDTIVGAVGADPDNILMTILSGDYSGLPSVFKVELQTGKRKLVKKGDVDVYWWVADIDGNVRAGRGTDGPTEKVVIKVLDPRKNEWVNAWTYTQVDEKPIVPLGFGNNPNELFVQADYNGRRAIYTADLMRDGYPLTLVLGDEKNDISGELIYLPTRKEVVGIRYVSAGETHSLFWSPELKKLQSTLDKALPGKRNSVVSVSDDLRKYIVFTSDATNPGSYLYGNRDTKEILPIEDTYSELNETNLVKKEYLSFKSRDGIELSGYLSRAKSNVSVPAPLIVLPPEIYLKRFNEQFDSLSAFLVNRGYSVYQPNISDSRSLNGLLSLNSLGNLGLQLHYDIEDAAQYLIKSKIASPEKMCIAGKEYGGFAALMAAVTSPTLFKCAISYAGISHIGKTLGSRTYFGNKETMRKIMGSEEQQLQNAAPVLQADNIKIPVLLIHGSDDTDVRVQQSQMMADELKRLNKTYEYIELDGGSHDLTYQPYRKKVYEAIEIFLQKYLPL
jgi:dipeptidyl aminopeptidase/acylaminoacyl peptidase